MSYFYSSFSLSWEAAKGKIRMQHNLVSYHAYMAQLYLTPALQKLFNWKDLCLKQIQKADSEFFKNHF